DLEFPAVFVEIPYRGSTPEEVERIITRPLEEALATLSGVQNMNSNTHEQGVNIFLQFDWGQDISILAVQVKEKIDGVRHLLPDDLERIFIRKFSTADSPILTFRISSNRDLSSAYDMLQRNLVRRVERINGVSKVDLYGVEKQEIQIELQMDRLVAQGIDPERLIENLQRSHFMVTAGRINAGGRRLLVRPIGRLTSAEDLANLPVGNGTMRLRDIAKISFENPILDYGRHLDRRYAVGLDIFKESGANTVEVAEAVIAEVESISKLPEMDGIKTIFLENQAAGIVLSLNELLKSGAIGALFSLLVLFYFLRNVATTLIVAMVVPASLATAMGVMYFSNISLNVLSMLGLMLAVGLLVDNAVVVTENIHRHQRMNKDVVEATKAGVKEVALAVSAGTFTTVVVFLPNIISTDNILSIQIAHVAIPIVISLAASLIIAQTIVPLLASRLSASNGAPKPQSAGIDRLQDFHRRILTWTLDHHRAAIGLIFLLVAATAIPIKFVKVEMFEEATSKTLRLNYYVNGSYSVEKVEQAVDRIEDYLFAHKEEFEIKSVYSYYTPEFANSTIYLTDEKLSRSLEEIKKAIQDSLPAIAVGRPSLERKRSGGAENVGLQLSGKSSERLAELSREVADLLERVDGFETVRSAAETGNKEVHVVIDRERASQYGFTTMAIAQTVAAAMRGINLPRLQDDEGEIEVRLNLADRDDRTLKRLSELPIYQPETGQVVKLAALADFRIRNGPRRISRENRITSIRITANVDGLTTDEARDKIKEIMGLYKLPAGYSWSFGSSFNFEDDTAKTMMVNTLMALALIYFVMAGLFESLIFPGAIWSSILFAIIGVWWFFLITGTTFSLMAWIGVLILMGVVVNNGIVLIDRVNQLRDSGMPRREAILQGSHDRLRAIIMTASTTVLGLIPLAITNSQIGGDGPPYAPVTATVGLSGRSL
ncbi:MAG: efflux RND transporter permease subunit, partial [Candidatus Marinimicrobia bacterium]|nr:efflux RND transporter permease subunit [Candidatus Neomarinimicrobiota bacterium]